MTAKPKPIPGAVLVAYNQYKRQGLGFCLIIILDSGLYVEASARTAKAFETRLKAWTFDTLPTLYRSEVRVFLCARGEIKEVTLTRRAILS